MTSGHLPEISCEKISASPPSLANTAKLKEYPDACKQNFEGKRSI